MNRIPQIPKTNENVDGAVNIARRNVENDTTPPHPRHRKTKKSADVEREDTVPRIVNVIMIVPDLDLDHTNQQRETFRRVRKIGWRRINLAYPYPPRLVLELCRSRRIQRMMMNWSDLNYLLKSKQEPRNLRKSRS